MLDVLRGHFNFDANVGSSSTWSAIENVFCYQLLSFGQLLLTILFASILQCIWERFELINHLSTTTSSIGGMSYVKMANAQEIYTIDRWAQWHDELTNAVQIINQCYALPV